MKKLGSVLRVLLAVAAAGMAVWFLAPYFRYGVVNPGNIAGVALCFWTIVLCISPARRFLRRHSFFRVLYRIINIIYAVFLIYGAVASGAMLFAAVKQPVPNATAVVLGAEVTKSGEPSLMLQRRIEAAKRWLDDNPKSAAVLTGGKGGSEAVSEAECMYRELVDLGIKPDRLYREDKAANTVENFKFSLKLIEDNKLDRDLAVITDGFHQLRAGLIAQKQEAGNNTGAFNAETDLIFAPTYVVREWFALPLLLFK